MANIGFDAKRAFLNFSGLGNYSRAFINSMSSYYPENMYSLFTPEYDKKNKMFDFVKRDNIEVIMPRGVDCILPHSLWRSFGITKDIAKNEIEIFHGLSGELPSSNFSAKKVVTMHDAIFMRYPQLYKSIDTKIYEKKFANACKDSDKIIAISKQTADDIMSFFGAKAEKIEIIYQSCDKIFYNSPSLEQRSQIKQKYSLPEKFILSVGTMEERKNLETIVKALPEIPQEISLVAIGRATPYLQKVIATAKELGVSDRIKYIHNASFGDFPAIYKQAVALIYVSIFEGFGLPVLEGITAGVPVITSNISSMPEAGGDGAILVDPHNAKEIAGNIRELYNSSSLTNDLIKRGYLYARNFRDSEMSKHVNDLYSNLL